LQNDPAVAPQMLQAAEHLKKNDDLVFAHIALALAMLKDPSALPLIEKFLGRGIDRIDVDAVLKSSLNDTIAREMVRRSRTEVGDLGAVVTRRALALAMGIIGDERAAPMLREMWGKDQWSSLAVARAMASCGVGDAADAFVQLASQKEQASLAEISILCLGELLDKNRLARINRLITHNTYDGVRVMLAGERTYRITVVGKRDIANPFLYNFLEPLVFLESG
jgi:HEAT repeat protein